MSVRLKGRSLSPTKTEIIHEPSGARLVTSAPLDNGGEGNAFSPTDLCAASLGACAATIMGMAAAKRGLSLETSFEVEKEMNLAPRRLGRVTLNFTLRTDADEAGFAALVAAGKSCPVRLSLGEGVEVVERYARG